MKFSVFCFRTDSVSKEPGTPPLCEIVIPHKIVDFQIGFLFCCISCTQLSQIIICLRSNLQIRLP